MFAFDEQTGSVPTWGTVSDATSVTNTLEGLHKEVFATSLCRRNHTFVAVDLHRCIQRSGPAANTREKFLRARALHHKWLKQLRIVGASMAFRLSFTRNR